MAIGKLLCTENAADSNWEKNVKKIFKLLIEKKADVNCAVNSHAACPYNVPAGTKIMDVLITLDSNPAHDLTNAHHFNTQRVKKYMLLLLHNGVAVDKELFDKVQYLNKNKHQRKLYDEFVNNFKKQNPTNSTLFSYIQNLLN